MSTFQRARSEQQREMRRRAILDTAAGMLEEMSVGEVSLNELSRRVGLAKSNVLRYFESREAILLELLDQRTRRWLADLTARLATEVDQDETPHRRGDQLATAIADSLARHEVLCDLLSAQTAVLEHNVSVDTAVRYKRAAIAVFTDLTELVGRYLPELGARATTVCVQAALIAGAVWTHARPSPSVRAAYDADPALAVWRLEFTPALAETLAVLISGALARAER